MSFNEIPDLSEMKNKISEMEKENIQLKNQLEVLNNVISEKDRILNKNSLQHEELQKQYKQALDKIVELSNKTSGKNLTAEEERIYRMQLAEQASCISTLLDRVWSSENKNKNRNADSLQYSTISMENECRHSHHHQNADSYYYSSFCDPIPNIDKAEKKIISLHHKLVETSKRNDYYQNELKNWSKFIIQIFNITTEALDEYPEFPSDDPCAQRKIVLTAVKRLAKANSETPKINEKYMKLKEKYLEVKDYLNKIEKRCNHLSQVTQLNSSHTNIFKQSGLADLESTSDLTEENNEFFQKDKCYNINKKFSSHQNEFRSSCKHDIIQKDFDNDMIPNSNRKSKFDENKENVILKTNKRSFKKSAYDENEDGNSDLETKTRKKMGKFTYFEYSDNDEYDDNPSYYKKTISNQYAKKGNQINKKTTRINTNESESFNYPIHNKTKININKQTKRQFKEISNNKHLKDEKKSNLDDDSDLYSKFGANISRLSKITKNMKNDYYDFAKLTKEFDTDHYSIEEISNMNSNKTEE